MSNKTLSHTSKQFVMHLEHQRTRIQRNAAQFCKKRSSGDSFRHLKSWNSLYGKKKIMKN